MKQILLATALLLLVVLPASGTDPLDKGLSLYLDVKLPEALTAFRAVAADEGVSVRDRARAHQYAALTLAAMGGEDLKEAQEEVRAMFRADPTVPIDVDVVPTSFLRLCYAVSKEMDLLAVQSTSERDAVLAVFDFDVNAMEQPEKMQALGPGLSQMLVTDLTGVPDLRVVERQKLQFVLDEIEHQQSGKVDPETAARAGKLIGAGVLMFGSILSGGEKMSIDVRLVRTETGEIIRAGRIEGETKKFYELQKDLAEMVVKELLPKEGKVSLPPGFGSPQTKSFEAALAYSEGIRLMDEGNLKEAYARFTAATALSPDFAAAKRRLEGLKPFLES
jgi:TolB-like protein